MLEDFHAMICEDAKEEHEAGRYRTTEEAMEAFNEQCDYIKLPTNGEYVDGSFELSTQDVEEMEAMVAIR